jgi:hypothetical protein
MIDKNRRAVLLGVAALLAVPAFAGVAIAGKRGDSHGSQGGGGEGGEHPGESNPPETDQHDDDNGEDTIKTAT